MKCPHCGIEVEPGTIFCPECLTEIPWVPEYNTVETLMTKKEETKKEQHRRKLQEHHRGRKKNPWLRVAVILFVCLFVGLAIKFGLDYKHYSSFDYQYQKAQEKYEKEDYSSAASHIDRALELSPYDEDANILDALILQGLDDTESAVSILEAMIAEDTDNTKLYGALIEVYELAQMPQEIHKLLAECKEEEILKAFADYIAKDPTTSVETGVYDEELSVELLGEGDTIYYTLDGSDPTEESSVYQGPIPVKEGVLELKAFAVNEKGIPSDIIYRKYTVVIKGPDAPAVTPEEGTYGEPTTITMEVPEGCKGYYAFDNPEVSTASQEYTGPVSMPEGAHVFYGILVAANGKESDIVTKSYTYTPGADTSSGQ